MKNGFIYFPRQLNMGGGMAGLGGSAASMMDKVGGMDGQAMTSAMDSGGSSGGGQSGIMDMISGIAGGQGGSGGSSGGSDIYKSGAGGMQGAAEDMGAGTVQMITGIAQLATAAKKKRDAEKHFPSLIDPLEARAYGELKRLERASETGVGFRNDLNTILAGEQATNRGIASRSGGAVGMAVAGMSKTNRMFAKSMNDLLQEAQKTRLYYSEKASAKQEKITDTKRDLQLLKYNQKMAEATQAQQEGKSNTLGGVTRAMAGTNSLFANMYGMGG